MTDTTAEVTEEETAEVEVGTVLYDDVFGIAVVLVGVTKTGWAVWELLDHAEGKEEED